MLQIETVNQDLVTKIGNVLLDQGVAGVVIIILLYALWKMNDMHTKEREKQQKNIKELIDARTADFKENNKDLRSVLDRYHDFASELRMLIKMK